MAAAYRYDPLSDVRIRLFSLLPGRRDDPLYGEISEVDFFHDPNISPAYEALSYVWGHEVSPHALSIVETAGGGVIGTLSLGVNLHAALCHLRLEHSRRNIWCDRICINQDNHGERACQVARMADVYQRAQRVIVWLGHEADGSALAMDAMRFTGLQVRIDPITRTWRPTPGADPNFSWEARHGAHLFSQDELEAIKRLVARSWFKRLWTRQEVTLAKSAVVVAGDAELPWTDFVSAAFFMDSLVRLRGKGDADFGRDLFNLYELGCLKTYKGIIEILHACRACECSEAIDRVYGILGLLSAHQCINIQPDYSKCAKSAYRDLVMESYRCSRRLDMFALCEAPKKPSWVPDLDNLNLNTGLNTRVVPYCRASGEAAGWLALSEEDTVEVYGVRCGVLGKRVAPRLTETSEPSALKGAIVEILRNYMGENVPQWDRARLETLAKGLLGSIWHERTGRQNHSSLAFAMLELQRWALEPLGGISDDSRDNAQSRDLFNHITRVLFHGDSCRLMQHSDGGLGLGFNGCEEGDVLYAILGCRRLIALRNEPERGKYRVIGNFDHSCYNDGEALLGNLGRGWKAKYDHGLSASNRPRFEHETGARQWQDPRLQCVPLPDGWCEGEDRNGYPYWFKVGKENERSENDPRLTGEELRKRGIHVERLVIV